MSAYVGSSKNQDLKDKDLKDHPELSALEGWILEI